MVCYGDATCANARISGISRVIASGTDALANSIIVSQLGGGTLRVAIKGLNSYSHEIYCNLTDLCKIDCQSQYGCQNVELVCFGTCFVDCNGDIYRR